MIFYTKSLSNWIWNLDFWIWWLGAKFQIWNLTAHTHYACFIMIRPPAALSPPHFPPSPHSRRQNHATSKALATSEPPKLETETAKPPGPHGPTKPRNKTRLCRISIAPGCGFQIKSQKPGVRLLAPFNEAFSTKHKWVYAISPQLGTKVS